jgi:hypothetical protein
MQQETVSSYISKRGRAQGGILHAAMLVGSTQRFSFLSLVSPPCMHARTVAHRGFLLRSG